MNLTLEYSNQSFRLSKVAKKDNQKWTFKNKKLQNVILSAKALGVTEGTCCKLTMVDTSKATTWVLHNGDMTNLDTGGQLKVDESGHVVLTSDELVGIGRLSTHQTAEDRSLEHPTTGGTSGWTAVPLSQESSENEVILSCTSEFFIKFLYY